MSLLLLSISLINPTVSLIVMYCMILGFYQKALIMFYPVWESVKRMESLIIKHLSHQHNKTKVSWCVLELKPVRQSRVNCEMWVPVRPNNECVSPQGSVEAQCGLVLNGQGGVIRRGKAPRFSSSSSSSSSSFFSSTGGREHSQLDTTRQRADRQTGGTLPSCLLSTCYSRNGPIFSPI